jgi:hypothetical protein
VLEQKQVGNPGGYALFLANLRARHLRSRCS